MDTGLILGLVGATVTVSGWIYTKWREDRTRRLEVAIKYRENQIEQFYGPLFNLVHQIFIANHIQYELLNIRGLTEEKKQQIRDFFQATYFMPLHGEINSIIKTKLHLIDGSEMPDSFYLYLKHSAQEKVQRALWSEHSIDTSPVSGEPFPNEFYNDLRDGLKKVMTMYEEGVQSLK